MRVVKQRRGGIIHRVELVDDGGQPLEVVCRFLSHLADRGYSPHTLCAYCYDLRHLFVFLERDGRS
jgi:integrase/recombinase XerD